MVAADCVGLAEFFVTIFCANGEFLDKRYDLDNAACGNDSRCLLFNSGRCGVDRIFMTTNCASDDF